MPVACSAGRRIAACSVVSARKDDLRAVLLPMSRRVADGEKGTAVKNWPALWIGWVAAWAAAQNPLSLQLGLSLL
eukprot:365637-Chlamydomonas_euryale.AAC.5